jgi:glycosyltransferase involved in cell wall biosynthesis
MKRILLVTTSYPDRDEGEAAAGVFVRDFARALTGEGVAVEVVAPAATDGHGSEDDIDVTRFAVPRLPLSLLDPMRVGDWKAIAASLSKGTRTVFEACRRRRPDHILALWALPSGDWAMRAGRRLGIPYSTWALGSDIWTLGRIPGLRQYLAHVLRNAAHSFADGFELAGDVERISGHQCRFLPSSRAFGHAGNRTVNAAPPYRLAFLGRWHPNKGVDLLIEALSLLNEEDWSRIEAVRLHGGGPLETQVRSGVTRLREAGRPVEVGGYLDLQGARDLFQWTDYVVIPSRIESIPVVFSDAMQARRPVIAAPVGDLPRLVNTLACGVLAQRADEIAMAEAIRRALALTADGFEEGLSRGVEMFDLDKAAQAFLDGATQQ